MTKASETLTIDDCEMVLESLRYTRKAFADYKDYPSAAFRTERIAKVDSVRDKVMSLKRAIAQLAKARKKE